MEEEEGEPSTFVVYCSFRPPAVEVGQAVSELLSALWMSVRVAGGLVLSLPPWVGCLRKQSTPFPCSFV